MVESLLEAGADPNMALPFGETPLMTAARTGSADVVGPLLAKGAEVDAATQDGAYGAQTALMWAVAQKHPAVVEVLLAHGANVNEVGPDGASALAVAALSGHRDVGAYLLDHGADPNAAEGGYAPLHAAILHRDLELAEALLSAGADPNARVSASTRYRRDAADFHFPPWFVGAPAFWLAARHRDAEMMHLLAQYGADPLARHGPGYWTTDRQRAAGRMRAEEGETTALMAAVGLGGSDTRCGPWIITQELRKPRS